MEPEIDREALALSGLPQAVRIARGYAQRRELAWMLDDLESAAGLACWRAACQWDPSRGVPWGAWLTQVVRTHLLDATRSVLGLRAAGSRRRRPILRNCIPIDEIAWEIDGPSDVLDSGELPVGWEIEEEDTIHWLARQIGPLGGSAIRAMTLDARSGGTRAGAGDVMGIGESAVSARLLRARSRLLAAIKDHQRATI